MKNQVRTVNDPCRHNTNTLPQLWMDIAPVQGSVGVMLTLSVLDLASLPCPSVVHLEPCTEERLPHRLIPCRTERRKRRC